MNHHVNDTITIRKGHAETIASGEVLLNSIRVTPIDSLKQTPANIKLSGYSIPGNYVPAVSINFCCSDEADYFHKKIDGIMSGDVKKRIVVEVKLVDKEYEKEKTKNV